MYKVFNVCSAFMDAFFSRSFMGTWFINLYSLYKPFDIIFYINDNNRTYKYYTLEQTFKF